MVSGKNVNVSEGSQCNPFSRPMSHAWYDPGTGLTKNKTQGLQV